MVRNLEAGQLSLDEASGLFEEGMRLAKRCNELLSHAELRITRLRSQFAEQMDLVPGEPGAGGLMAAEDDED